MQIVTLLSIVNIEVVFEQPFIAFSLQIIFVLGTSIAIAIISAKSYVNSGAVNVLLLGSAILVSGIASTVSFWTLTSIISPTLTANEVFTIDNLGLLFSSTILLASAITTVTGFGLSVAVHRKLVLLLTYGLCLFGVGVLSWTAAFDLMPVFLSTNGPTFLGTSIVLVAACFYVVCCILFAFKYWQTNSAILFWSFLAVALIGISLVTSALTMRLGDAMNWMSRASWYLSGVFFLFALLSHETKAQDIGLADRWAQAFRADRKQFTAFFATMLNAFAYCKIVTDSVGKPVDWVYLDVNDAFERVTGFKREVVIGKRASQLHIAEQTDSEDWVGKYGHVAVTGEPTRLEGYSQSFGKWLNVSTYSPKKGFFVSIFEDISERKMAEEALAKSEQRWVTTLSSIGDAVIATDIAGNITFMNHLAEDLTGWRMNEVAKKPLPEIFKIKETRQLKAVVITPPINGPAAEPIPAAALIIPKFLALATPVKDTVTKM